MYEYAAHCVAVHDGDTFTLNVDLGFDTWHIGAFRLLGCNARELAMPGGQEARLNLSSLLLNKDVVVRSAKPDKFGERYDALVTLSDGRDLTDWLVSQQWAMPWSGLGVKPVPPWPRSIPANTNPGTVKQ